MAVGQGEPWLYIIGHWDPPKKSDLFVGPRSRATPRRAAGPPMGGVGGTQGPHWGRVRFGRREPWICPKGGVLAYNPPPQTSRAAPPGRTLYGWDGSTLALHRSRVGLASGQGGRFSGYGGTQGPLWYRNGVGPCITFAPPPPNPIPTRSFQPRFSQFGCHKPEATSLKTACFGSEMMRGQR